LFVPLPLFIGYSLPVCTASTPPYCSSIFTSKLLYINGVALILDLVNSGVIHSLVCTESLQSLCHFYGTHINELSGLLLGVVFMYFLAYLIAFIFSRYTNVVEHTMKNDSERD